MNRLLLNNDDIITSLAINEDTEIIMNLSNEGKDLNIILEKDTLLSIVEFSTNTKNDFKINLNENSRLVYKKVGKNINDNINIFLDGNSASLDIKNSVVSTSNTKCVFNIIHNNINTTSNLSNHGINYSTDELMFNINANINSCADNSSTNQENKIINTNSGKSNILPNLIVDNDNVNATHSAYISDFDKETLFYLKSRGISETESRNLLMEGFLFGNLNLPNEYIEQAKEILKIY